MPGHRMPAACRCPRQRKCSRSRSSSPSGQGSPAWLGLQRYSVYPNHISDVPFVYGGIPNVIFGCSGCGRRVRSLCRTIGLVIRRGCYTPPLWRYRSSRIYDACHVSNVQSAIDIVVMPEAITPAVALEVYRYPFTSARTYRMLYPLGRTSHALGRLSTMLSCQCRILQRYGCVPAIGNDIESSGATRMLRENSLCTIMDSTWTSLQSCVDVQLDCCIDTHASTEKLA